MDFLPEILLRSAMPESPRGFLPFAWTTVVVDNDGDDAAKSTQTHYHFCFHQYHKYYIFPELQIDRYVKTHSIVRLSKATWGFGVFPVLSHHGQHARMDASLVFLFHNFFVFKVHKPNNVFDIWWILSMSETLTDSHATAMSRMKRSIRRVTKNGPICCKLTTYNVCCGIKGYVIHEMRLNWSINRRM